MLGKVRLANYKESNENNSIPSSEPVFGVVGGGNSEIKKQYVENSWLFTKRR
mgnify:CR=1 FL=1